MTRGIAVIVMFVGRERERERAIERERWRERERTLNNDVTSASSIKRLRILSGIINTLGCVVSVLALEAKGCHSPADYFWKQSPNYGD